jgi:hypothetical protein
MAFLKAKGVNLDEGSKYLDSSSLSFTNGSTQVQEDSTTGSNPYETGEVDVYSTEYQPGQSYQSSGGQSGGYSQI